MAPFKKLIFTWTATIFEHQKSTLMKLTWTFVYRFKKTYILWKRKYRPEQKGWTPGAFAENCSVILAMHRTSSHPSHLLFQMPLVAPPWSSLWYFLLHWAGCIFGVIWCFLCQLICVLLRYTFRCWISIRLLTTGLVIRIRRRGPFAFVCTFVSLKNLGLTLSDPDKNSSISS